jgi:hypothetical protein
VAGDQVLTGTTTLTSYWVKATFIAVAYESSDLSLFPSGYTPGVSYNPGSAKSSGSFISTSATFSSSSTSPTRTLGTASPSTSSNSKLGAGAIAGIVIGAVIAILIAVLLLLLILRRNKIQKTKEPRPLPDGLELGGEDIKELGGEEKKRPRVELASAPTPEGVPYSSTHELNAAAEAVELHPESSPAVLPASELDNSPATQSNMARSGPAELASNTEASATGAGSHGTFSSSRAGPVPEHLTQPVSDRKDTPGTVAAEPSSSVPGAPVASSDAPLSESQLELKWLEAEEERIKQRKAQLSQNIEKGA